jgi:hypothetical protein
MTQKWEIWTNYTFHSPFVTFINFFIDEIPDPYNWRSLEDLPAPVRAPYPSRGPPARTSCLGREPLVQLFWLSTLRTRDCWGSIPFFILNEKVPKKIGASKEWTMFTKKQWTNHGMKNRALHPLGCPIIQPISKTKGEKFSFFF